MKVFSLFRAPSSASSFVPNPDGIAMLEAMGMPTKKCIKALKATDNNVERAVDWIFSHLDDDGTEEPMDTSIAPAVPAAASGNSGGHKLTDGEPKYELQAFISHMGSSVHVGHYVCHILREGKWVIYNDNKVALSERPPKGLGYLYLYKRKDASSS
jgi:ubiquitin carboxyl-terminal hydrolase 5/13